MKSFALMFGVVCVAACATARAPTRSERHPRIGRQVHLTVTNSHRQRLEILAGTEGGVWPVGRVDDLSTETFRLAPYFAGKSIWLVLRCRAHRESYTTPQVVADPGVQIDLVVGGRLTLSRMTFR